MKLKNKNLLSLVLVAMLFVIYLIFHSQLEIGFSFFIFGICAIHLIIVMVNKWYNNVPITRDVHICNLAMLTISCYSLNREIQIFAPFTSWVNIVLIILFIVLLLEEYLEINSNVWKIIYAFTLTTGLWVALYFTFILAPILHIGLIAIIVFGLGLHVFIPLILSFTLIVYLSKQVKNKYAKTGIIASTLLLIISFTFFFSNLYNANNTIEKANINYVSNEDQILPRWISIAQKIPNNKWTEMLLIGDYKYDLFDNWFMDRGFNGGGNSLSEMGIHEPFLNLAKLTGYYKLDLSDEERISILKTNFNKRHETTRKLWTGEHLETSQAITDVKLYPDYRIAYTQKTFLIKNTQENDWQQEEALYTIKLSQDAVVNSMSLWVNGIERKSYLTTKEKADSAYVNIVGVQNRDPALLHWQEGNKVSVTVFPCTSKEIRMLKIGYTSALEVNKNVLLYKDVFIEGPSFNTCKQNVQISSTLSGTKITSKQLNFNFAENKYNANFTGDKEWVATLPLVPLSDATFSFNQKTFKVVPEIKEQVEKQIDNIILDLNSNWTRNEFDEIIKKHSSHQIWYSTDQAHLIKINQENQHEIWKSMSSLRFNLLPFQKINPSNSVIITKAISTAPSFKELDKCQYAKSLANSVQNNTEPILCYNIGEANEATLYNTLNNFNYLHIIHTSINNCLESIQNNQFSQNQTSDVSINIDEADMNILQVNDSTRKGAPDHLMRLFYCKKIQEQAGKYYFEPSNTSNLKTCVDMANEAFIVSPVSSLIVLETDKDYDDFGIDKNQNSLLNATKKGKGAVPEPHEWLMIGIGLFSMLFLLAKQRRLL